jgi:hypothetical protein
MTTNQIPSPRSPVPIATLFLLITLISAALAYAFDWPSDHAAIISNFGANDNGLPMQGDVFRAEGPVTPSELGELLFYSDSSVTASRFPSPFGAWVALDHGDDLIGIYSRFEDRAVSRYQPIMEKETMLAAAGLSGWAEESGFSFAFFDRKDRRWVNPALIITPFPDDRPPTIRTVELRGASQAVNLAQARTIPQGAYSLYVDAVDTVAVEGKAAELAPNRIVCTVNGAEAQELKFEFISARDGSRMVWRNGLVPAEKAYHSPPGYEIGEIKLPRGKTNLVIEVRDIAENSRSATYNFNVE